MLINFLINTAQAVSLPTFGGGQDLPAFISSVYSFALTVVGIAVFFRILQAGFLWLTAAGNASKASDAKNKIQNAVIGTILLFASYLILYIINPDLVKNSFNFSIPRGPTTSNQPSSTSLGLTNGDLAIGGVPNRGITSGLLLQSAQAQVGVHVFTLKVVDANGDSYEQVYSMEILENSNLGSTDNFTKVKLSGGSKLVTGIVRAAEAPPLSITTHSVPDGVIDQPYFTVIQVSGGTAPYSWAVTDGNLPSGLNLQDLAQTPRLNIAYVDGSPNPTNIFVINYAALVTITNGPANSPAQINWTHNGQTDYPGQLTSSNVGGTDSSGNWSVKINFQTTDLGIWQASARFGNLISNTISFSVFTAPAVGSSPPPGVSPAPTVYKFAPPTCAVPTGLPTCVIQAGISGLFPSPKNLVIYRDYEPTANGLRPLYVKFPELVGVNTYPLPPGTEPTGHLGSGFGRDDNPLYLHCSNLDVPGRNPDNTFESVTQLVVRDLDGFDWWIKSAYPPPDDQLDRLDKCVSVIRDPCHAYDGNRDGCFAANCTWYTFSSAQLCISSCPAGISSAFCEKR